MLEVVYGWRSLYSRHAVEKLDLIALLCQASHFPVFDWLLTSLKYLTQSANILSIAPQAHLSCQYGVAAGFFLQGNIARAFGLLALDVIFFPFFYLSFFISTCTFVRVCLRAHAHGCSVVCA